ncbi:hypothetical protein [Vibrio metschnikovii]|uniref:hypothetical protein n=1 Tax=Vibrio metschnikovii TaxID=28172 RepID=UPI001C2F25E4|nr:hypothetical protein [Vibrio metschnikovii]
MSELFQKILDLVLPKVKGVIDTTFNLWISPVSTLSEKLEEGKQISFSLLFFLVMSALAYSILLFGLLSGKIELDSYKLGFGFVLSQFIMLVLYSLAALLALKISRVKATWRKVLMSTAYLYGQVTIAAATLCSIIIYAVLNGVCDVQSGIWLTLIAGFCLLCFGWSLMCKVLDATYTQTVVSFVIVSILIISIAPALGVISRPLVHF